MWIAQKIKDFFISEDSEYYDEREYKRCDNCEGLGLEDLFQDCPECMGEGIIKKTFKEKYDLPE